MNRIEFFIKGSFYYIDSKYAKQINRGINEFKSDKTCAYDEDSLINSKVFSVIDMGSFIYAVVKNNMDTIENAEKAKILIINDLFDGDEKWLNNINKDVAIEYQVKKILSNKLKQCALEVRNCDNNLTQIIKRQC